MEVEQMENSVENLLSKTEIYTQKEINFLVESFHKIEDAGQFMKMWGKLQNTPKLKNFFAVHRHVIDHGLKLFEEAKKDKRNR